MRLVGERPLLQVLTEDHIERVGVSHIYTLTDQGRRHP